MKAALKELLEGYGFEKVPRSIVPEQECCVCREKGSRATPHYSAHPFPTSTNKETYSKQLNLLRINMMCAACFTYLFFTRGNDDGK